MKLKLKRNMNKKLFFIVLLIVSLLPLNAYSEKNIKIGFLPFNIYAGKNNQPLSKKIPAMISEVLNKAEAKSIIIDKEYKVSQFNYQTFKKIGIEYGTDYIVVGSLFEAGDKMSIDIKIIDIYQSKPAKSYFAQISGIEKLHSAVTQLGKNIISEIFQKKIILKIGIQGNKRIEDDAILRAVDIKPKDILYKAKIAQNIKNIYKLGYFKDVQAEKVKLDTGVKIIFKVVERPSVRIIKFNGNRKFEEKELKEVVTTTTGSILNIFKINRDSLRIKALYKTKNYHNCKVDYDIKETKNNQADIVFKIIEGEKLKIKEISFEGNKYFDDDDLLDEMETNEKGFFSFITSSGNLDRAKLQRDVIKIESLYKNNGFLDASVPEPEIKFGKKSILVHFEIKEGLQYKVKKVNIQGDLILSEKELFKKIKIDDMKFYSRKVLRNDIFTLSDIYTDKGYAQLEISPLVDRDNKEHNVELTIIIKKGRPVYFGRIIIKGNNRTRDKVIRRELKAIETELYSKKKIQKSLQNLKKLKYFKTIDVNPSPGTNEDTMDLNIDVVEKTTGKFTFGGGYSTKEKLFGMIELSEGNLFGKGQTIKFKTQLSSSSLLFSLKYIEPWLFDIPLSTGIELYNQDEELDHYDKKSKGGGVSFSYPVFEYTRIGISYSYEDFTISNVDKLYTTVENGHYLTASISPNISYDSRDRDFCPRKGLFSILSVQYADKSLGGDISFTKSLLDVGLYIPVFWKFTWVIHGKSGYLDDRTNGHPDIDYERFYLGGINSIRGFKPNDIYASKINGKERGGEKFIQFNTEITFPLVEDQGVSGVLFYDQGDVFLKKQPLSLSNNYASFGLGIRWDSPMGPMRLEYGIIKNGRGIDEDGNSRFQFTIGARF